MATTTYKVLGQVNPAANTVSTLYKAPAYVSTVISSITVCNQSNAATTFSIAVRPADASLTSKHYLNYNTALQPYDTVPITIGMTLATTDVVDVSSTSSNVSFTAFGSEIADLPVSSIPTINSVVITDSGYNTTNTTAISTSSGGYIKLLGSGFSYNPTVYVGTTSTSAIYVSNVEVRAQVPNNPVGTYKVMLFNGTGVGTVYQSGLLYSPEPTLTTGVYAGTYFLNVQLAGSGDAPLTYSLISGSLPPGASLSSTGLITGTAISYGTYTFTVKITDAQNQYITPTVQLSIATMPSNIELLLVGGGGAGGGSQSTNARGGGGGAGGLVYFSSQTVSIGVLYAITVGAGGTGASALPGVTGTNSTFIGGTSTIVAIAGGGGGSWVPDINGIAGGSGGGGAGVNTGIGGTSTQFATYGYGVGYPGGTGTAYINNTGSSGAGGGGAGSKGSDAAAGAAGTGGTGTFTAIISTTLALTLGIGQYITATNSVYFAGGGGGGGGTASGIGGYGGGGGGALTTDLGTAGTPYTGGGGGGAGGGGGGTAAGANGGSGVAILRYPSSYGVFPFISGSYNLTTASGYNTYLFTGSSYLYLSEQPIVLPTVEYVIVGGGGGAGNTTAFSASGGGGAGGYSTGTFTPLIFGTSYVVTVGGGGAVSTTGTSTSIVGLSVSLSVLGGGAGASTPSPSGTNRLGGAGASGGGSAGWNSNTTIAGGAGTAGQGNAGGGYTGSGSQYASGGGGGAGGPGGQGNAITVVGGLGGTGTFTTMISTTTAISLGIGQYGTATNAIYFAGGGSGLANDSLVNTGGLGGGGNGSTVTAVGQPGRSNSGGGGGGATNTVAAGPGGSGVVILRYPTSYPAATSTAGTGTNVFIENGYRYYVFKSSGSITF